MEDGAARGHAGDPAQHTPPAPPEPKAADKPTAQAVEAYYADRSDRPLHLDSESWDIESISAVAALHMLIGALQDLADAMGDVPPTPPVSRPPTPNAKGPAQMRSRRTSSPTLAGALSIGSPEAQSHEPTYVEHGADAEDATLQRVAIARRFFSKTAPPFSIREYLLRIHQYCPHSPGVYLAAAVYCQRLCVAELLVPATHRTIHRLSLSAIRIAAKALEDNKWSQERMAGVGGVSKRQLLNLEVALCFLLDFELGVCDTVLARRMFLLQQAGRQGLGARSKLGGDFRLRLPLRRRLNTIA